MPTATPRASPDSLSARMAVALSLRGRMPETASAMRLRAKLGGTGALPIREQAEIGARATLSAMPPRSGGKGGAFQLKGAKRISRLGAGVAANVRRPFAENPSHLALSRAPQRDPSPAHIPRLCAA